MKTILLTFITLFQFSAYSYIKYNKMNYCIVSRNYVGMMGVGDYMSHLIIYKFKKKLPEIGQYSLTEISNLKLNKVVESSYKAYPYKSSKSVSLLVYFTIKLINNINKKCYS